MVPDKLKWPFRKIVVIGGYAAKFMLVIPHFVRVHPTSVSASTIITTLAAMAFFSFSRHFFVFFLLLTIFLSMADRFVVREYYSYNASDRVCALVSDRISEGLLFLLFFKPWFFLFTVNSVLMVYSYVRKHNFTLPLKEIFTVYYLLFLL